MRKIAMVGEEVVKRSNNIKALPEGAGENGSLKPKGNFERSPHQDSPDVHGWQPIETAPIDTAVLVYGFGYEVAHHNSLLGKWVAVWNHRPIRIRPDTVWMPLPAPPVLP